MNWRSILKEDKDTFTFDEDGKPMTLEEWSNKDENDYQIYQQNMRGNIGSKWESLKRDNLLRGGKEPKEAIVQFLEEVVYGITTQQNSAQVFKPVTQHLDIKNGRTRRHKGK